MLDHEERRRHPLDTVDPVMNSDRPHGQATDLCLICRGVVARVRVPSIDGALKRNGWSRRDRARSDLREQIKGVSMKDA